MGYGAFMAAHEAARRNNGGMRRRDDKCVNMMPEWDNTGSREIYDARARRAGWENMDGRARRVDNYRHHGMVGELEELEEDDENGGEEEKYKMTKEKAVAWIESLENEDPAHPHGARWTMEEVKPLAVKHGIKENTPEFVEFWATMNMLYSDYYNVFKEYNLISAEAFAKMAKAFLHDRDAMDHKLGRYYCAVVKK